MRRHFIAAITLAALGMAGCASLQEPQYPTQPVKLIVPYPPGNVADNFGRIMAEKLAQMWGQPVTVENQPGIRGVVAAARAKADGYTLLGHSISYAVDAGLYTNLPYDPDRDLQAIAPYARQPFALVAAPALGVKTVADLVALAKSKPGQLKFGSLGTRTQIYFVAEQFKKMAGIDAVNVSFKSLPEANAAVAKGEIAFWFPPVAGAMAGVKEGKLIALAITSGKRAEMLPQVPTMAEAGIANMDNAAWFGFWAPAGVPPAIAKRIAGDIARATEAPEVREKFAKAGAQIMRMSPEEFAAFVRDETAASKRQVKELGIQPQPYAPPAKP